MRVVRHAVLFVALLLLVFTAPSFNSPTLAQGAIQFKNFSSHAAVQIFLNQQAQAGIELENLQITSNDDGITTRYSVFYRENPNAGAVLPYIIKRFNVSFAGKSEEDAVMDGLEFVTNYLNYVDGDFSEPNTPLRDAVLAVRGARDGVTFEIFHRQGDRGDLQTNEWSWFSQLGKRELSTLLLKMNGLFQENPRAFYPTDLISLYRMDEGEHIFYNFYQLSRTGSRVDTPVGWVSQSFTSAESATNFLNQQSPDEFRVAADHDVFEWIRVFWR